MENVPGALKALSLAALFLSIALGVTATQEEHAPPQTREPSISQGEGPAGERPRAFPDTRTENPSNPPDSPPTRESAEIPPSRESSETRPSEPQASQPRVWRDAGRRGRSEDEPKRRPNILFVLTDDQTARSVSKMPKLKSLVIEKGTKFNNFFTTTPRCCPSRATFLRGQYAHNSRILGNDLPQGGFKKFRNQGTDRSTVATWLDDAGYTTFYLGKYLNNYDDTTYVPPGWDQWFGWLGHYYSPEEYRINENGRIVAYERSRKHDTDLLRDKAVRFVESQAETDTPFFMYVAPNAPHKPAYVADRHEGMFSDTPLPKTPSFSERNASDKPVLIQDTPLITRAKKAELESLYQTQLASLQSVDDMMGDLIQTLQSTGQLENTYVMFSSDNGYFYGEHRLEEKSLAYEEAAKIPFIIRGPGVPTQKLDHLVINTDFAPTVAELAGTQTPGYVDGRPFVSLLDNTIPNVYTWRKRILLEFWAPDYKAVRTPRYKYVEYSTGEKELYDLRRDPYELRSRHRTANPILLRKFGEDLDRLRNCATTECRVAEQR